MINNLQWTLIGLICVVSGVIQQLEERFNFSIPEGNPVGTLVGKIPIKNGFTYRLQERSQFFDFDPSSGQLRLAQILDRESLVSDHVVLIILSSEPTYLIAVRVDIVDVNDNAPKFPYPFQNVTISESAKVGTQILLWSAQDPDTGANGDVSNYRIIGGNDHNAFRLISSQETKPDIDFSGTPSLYLALVTPLDRETRSVYILNITVQDRGSPPHSGYLTVFVTVLDSNDNAPSFNQSDYSVYVLETAPVGTVIGNLSASDPDEGINAQIQYGLVESTRISNRIFTVNPNTGLVQTVGSLSLCPLPKKCASSLHDNADGSCNRVCILTVEATDQGVPSQTGRCLLHVHIMDTNDHKPEITFRYYPENAKIAVIDEDQEPGSVVAVISVQDEDVGPNGRVTLQLLSGNEDGNFYVDSNSLFSLLRLKRSLDRTTKRVFNITVEATDHGQPPLSSRRSLLVYVKDSNSQPPQFTESTYSVSVPESLPNGSFVIAVKAEDSNQAVDDLHVLSDFIDHQVSSIRYRLVEGDTMDWFHLDSATGLISTKQILDYEALVQVTLKVEASSGIPSNTAAASTEVQIRILDTNDNSPNFGSNCRSMTILENSPVGSKVGQIEATDVDEGRAGEVRYRFADNLDPYLLDKFSLNEISGVIAVKQILDREIDEKYELAVTAEDQGNPQLSAFCNVNIIVQDVNDNYPSLYPTEAWVSLLTGAVTGQKILQFDVSDADTGINGEVYLQILQAPISSVEIDSSSGWLTLKRIPFGRDSVEIMVGAKDGGGLMASANATVYLNFVPSLATLPKFNKDNAENVTVTEHANSDSLPTNGQVITTIRAKDSEPQSQVVYHLTGGNSDGIFEIGLFSGEIRSVKPIDYELRPFYDLKVTAVGKYGSTSTNFHIEVQDLNDNTPHFVTGTKVVQRIVRRSWPVAYPVYRVRSQDADSGENSQLLYELDGSGEAISNFGIEPRSGILRLLQPGFKLNAETYSLTVLVRDHGVPQRTAKQKLDIRVVGHKQHSVEFPTSLALHVPENAPTNTRLVRLLNETLVPELDAELSFSVNDPTSVIAIFPDGWVHLTTELDYEKRSVFQYHISVLQRHVVDDDEISQIELTLNVGDVNDNKPTCLENLANFTILEEMPPLTLIGQFKARDLDTGDGGRLTYHLDDQHDFLIDVSTGQLRSKRTFDREAFSTGAEPTFLHFDIEVCDNSLPVHCTTCPVSVSVQDANDHTPRFSEISYTVSVPENRAPGSPLVTLHAFDPDLGSNGHVRYIMKDITSIDSPFFIKERTGQLYLKDNKTLDREVQDRYKYVVEGCDGGDLCGETLVIIDIEDINDNPPLGSNNPTIVNVSEATPIGTVIAVFNAVDPDSGSNGHFHYEIQSGNINTAFAIDPVEGTLMVQRYLDYETAPAYTMAIKATDHGHPPLSSTFSLVIEVIDENDQYPIIDSVSLVSQIAENSPVGTYVMTVSASDKDTGVGGELRFYILDQAPFDGFKIDSYTGEVRTATDIDREQVESFTIEIEVSDSPTNSLLRKRTLRTVSILVIDLNDNAPKLIGGKVATVPAASTTGYKIYQIQSSDLDFGINGSVGVRIAQKSDYFGIGMDGSVYLRSNLPINPSNPKVVYDLKIELFDRMDQEVPYSPAAYPYSLITQEAITIIADEGRKYSDFAFSRDDFYFEVYENATIGTLVGRLQMLRPFSPRSITFYIASIFSGQRPMPDWFQIGQNAGILKVKGQLDSDDGGDGIDMQLIAVGQDGRTANTKVHVHIVDVNDSPPVLHPASSRIHVSEGAPVGSIVFQATVHDPDSQGNLAYTLTNLSAPFSLDPSTGALTLSDALDRESIDEYRLKFVVNDGSHSTIGHLVIIVDDVNDHVPAFSEPNYIFRTWRTATAGTFVGVVSAVDQDKGRNGSISYRFTKSSAYFQLDKQTGVISVIGKLDYVSQTSVVTFEVEAMDDGSPKLYSRAQVFIWIWDPLLLPQFRQTAIKLSVPENASLDNPIGQIPLSGQQDMLVKYDILKGDAFGAFLVESDGTIWLEKNLDRELISNYSLLIRAYYPDMLNSARLGTSDLTIIIEVVDVNDNAPMPQMSSSTASIFENSPVGAVIATFFATDPDLGPGGRIRYDLDGSDASTFSIDPVSGILTVVGILDYEAVPEYNITIWISDYGNPQLRSSINFQILIIDQNDNQPKFIDHELFAEIYENIPPGTSITTLRATDLDSAGNAALIFDIIEGDPEEIFEILPRSGSLITKGILDGKRMLGHNLTVTVRNIGQRSSSDTAMVHIQVTEVNRYTPRFLKGTFYFSIYENHTSGLPALIGSIIAKDSDSGMNGKISYAIIQGNTSVFNIDAVTGELSAAIAVDREVLDSYQLTVTATDSGAVRLTGTGTVQISILDINDNPPQFMQPYYVFDIAEDEPAGSEVGMITAFDLDIGSNSKIKYRLKKQQSTFSIDEITGVIRLISTLDRELTDRYDLTVEASDHEGVFSAITSVVINVLDVNDNSPIITYPLLKDIYIPDNLIPGSVVLPVGAYDRDIGSNGELTYGLLPNPDSPFKINSDTGVVTVKKRVPYGQSLTLGIFVSDGGGEMRRNASTIVNIFVHSAQNFPVCILESQSKLSALENAESSMITMATARSPKQPPFNRITFQLAAGNVNKAFYIDSYNGKLWSTSTLDREAQENYELWVVVVDNDNPPLPTYCKISIQVTDANDNAPIWEMPLFEAKFSENLPSGQLVIHVEADDADKGANGKLQYQIISGNDEAAFQINSATGELQTSKPLDRETLSKYKLTILAKDHGTPPLSGICQINIEVMDTNDNAPKFTRLLAVDVPENAPVGYFVIKVEATDLDGIENANNTYYFSENSASSNFQIDPYSGNVTIARQLDRERSLEHHLKVIAVDGTWRIETSLSVTVLDVNDNSPKFTLPTYMFKVVGSKGPFPRTIGMVNASDADSPGPNSHVMYSMMTQSNSFDVNPLTGAVMILQPLQINSKASYSRTLLEIAATDFGVPQLSERTSAEILVYPENLYEPKFSRSTYFSPLPVTASFDEAIFHTVATDGDQPENEISYILEHENGLVRIGKSSGTLFLAHNSTELELGKKLKITIRAIDSGIPAKAGTCTVVLVISDPISSIPRFSLDSYNKTLQFSTLTSNSSILFLETLTSSFDMGEIQFAISGKGSENFAINPTTGRINLAQNYSGVKGKTFHFTASAGYPGSVPALLAQADIFLSISNGFRFKNRVVEFFIRPKLRSIKQTIGNLLEVLEECDQPYFYITGKKSKLNGHVRINRNTGQVYLIHEKPLEKSIISFPVAAVCKGEDDQKATATVVIHIEPSVIQPMFNETTFKFDVPLNVNPEQAVAVVHALGGNQDVMYTMNSGSEESSYQVDQDSGIISAAVPIRRGPGQIKLMVHAIIKCLALSNSACLTKSHAAHTTVLLRFSPTAQKLLIPAFKSNSQTLKVEQSASVGSTIFNFAKLLDLALQSNTIEFSLQTDQQSISILPFNINKKSGILTLSTPLSSTKTAVYYFTIVAQSIKVSAARTSTMVKIEVININKQGAMLTPLEKIGTIFENRPSGTTIMALGRRSSETQRYQVKLLDNQDNFEFDSQTGILKSRRSFDREQKSDYNVHVSILNPSSPTSSSPEELLIKIQDMNDLPSTINSWTASIALITSSGFSGTLIIPVYPRDPDQFGHYQCKYLKTLPSYLKLRQDCHMAIEPSALMTRKNIQVGLEGYDGIHAWVRYDIDIQGHQIDDFSLQRAWDVTMSQQDIITWLKAIVTVQNPPIPVGYSQTGLFVVAQNGMSKIALEESWKRQGLTTGKIQTEFCQSQPCQNGGTCIDKVTAGSEYRTYDTHIGNSWTLPNVSRSYSCRCAANFAGKNCELSVNYCADDPCLNGGTCDSSDGSVTCTCAVGFYGDHCEEDVNECSERNRCMNGGYCENIRGGYRCICLLGYAGVHCATKVDECAGNPCLNGASCSPSGDGGYSCACEFGFFGPNCQHSSFGFDWISYLRLPSLRSHQNHLAIEFSTLEPNALLLLSYNQRMATSSDYIALDMVEGQLRLSGQMDGQNLMNVLLKQKVNNGEWHKLELIQTGQSVTLSVLKCQLEEKTCRPCLFGDDTCRTTVDIGINSIPVEGHSAFLGTVDNFSDLLKRPRLLAGHGFKGCIRNLTINEHQLSDIVKASRGFKLLEQCPRTSESGKCESESCGEHGTCIDKWDHSVCACDGRFFASKCSEYKESVKLSKGAYIRLNPDPVYSRDLVFQPITISEINNVGKRFRWKRQLKGIQTGFENRLQLRFRTTLPDSNLVWSGLDKDQFIMIYLKNGSLYFTTKSYKANPVTVILDRIINGADGEWHDILLAYDTTLFKAEIQLDGYGKAIRFKESMPALIGSNGFVVLGSLPDKIAMDYYPTKFDGCVGSFVIDGELQELSSEQNSSKFSISFVKPEGGLVQLNCGDQSICLSPPCLVPFEAANALHPGVISLVTFFAALILIGAIIFAICQYRKSLETKSSDSGSKNANLSVICNNSLTVESRLTSLSGWQAQHKQVSQEAIYAVPNLHGTEHGQQTAPRSSLGHHRRDNSGDMLTPVSYFGGGYSNEIDPIADERPERYDLDNASSIAPSDVDVGYHYRGYRETPNATLERDRRHSIGRSAAQAQHSSGTHSMNRSRRHRRGGRSDNRSSPASSLHSGSQRSRRHSRPSSRRRNVTSADILSAPQTLVMDTSSSSSNEFSAHRRSRLPPSRSSSAKRRSVNRSRGQSCDSSTEMPSSEDDHVPVPARPPPPMSVASLRPIRSGPILSLANGHPASHPSFPIHTNLPRGAFQVTTDEETDLHDETVPELSSFVNRSGELNNLIIGRGLSSSNETLSEETQH